MKNLICPLIILISISCKKKVELQPVSSEPQITLLHPIMETSQWLMAYPGSHWTYDNGFTDTVSAYVVGKRCAQHADYVSVPIYRNSVLFGNLTEVWCYPKNYAFENLGGSSSQPGTVHKWDNYCANIDTTMTVSGVYYDSVQKVVTEYTFVPEDCTRIEEINYYQYGVGCIKTEFYNPPNTERNLTNFFIAPH
jgi:hypothetical protein